MGDHLRRAHATHYSCIEYTWSFLIFTPPKWPLGEQSRWPQNCIGTPHSHKYYTIKSTTYFMIFETALGPLWPFAVLNMYICRGARHKRTNPMTTQHLSHRCRQIAEPRMRHVRCSLNQAFCWLQGGVGIGGGGGKLDPPARFSEPGHPLIAPDSPPLRGVGGSTKAPTHPPTLGLLGVPKVGRNQYGYISPAFSGSP